MRKGFKILQANLRKSRETQLNLMNDKSLQEFALLLITEPSCSRNAEGKAIITPIYHNYWTQQLPLKLHAEGAPVRSMIWVRKGMNTRPIPTSLPDLTATLLSIEGRNILALSVYVEAKQSAEDAELNRMLEEIRTVIHTTRNNIHDDLELIIAGDFNKHDPLWGGDIVGNFRRD